MMMNLPPLVVAGNVSFCHHQYYQILILLWEERRFYKMEIRNKLFDVAKYLYEVLISGGSKFIYRRSERTQTQLQNDEFFQMFLDLLTHLTIAVHNLQFYISYLCNHLSNVVLCNLTYWKNLIQFYFLYFYKRSLLKK